MFKYLLPVSLLTLFSHVHSLLRNDQRTILPGICLTAHMVSQVQIVLAHSSSGYHSTSRYSAVLKDGESPQFWQDVKWVDTHGRLCSEDDFTHLKII